MEIPGQYPVPSPAAASSSTAVAVALGAVAVTTAVLCWRRSRRATEDDPPRDADADADADPPSCRENQEIPDDIMPSDGVFTIESLKKFDGRELPMCLGVCGKVVNVSSSLNFTPDQGYGKLWAGAETTYSMAKVSLKPEDANRMDWKLEDFSDQERTALAGWYKHFTTKYPVVGMLKEYEGWDFSSVLAEAETQTPFGAGKAEAGATSVAEPGAIPQPEPKADDVTNKAEAATKQTAATPAGAETTTPEGMVVPDGGVVLRRGMRVTISGISARPELNGQVAILEDYVADKGRFAVKLEIDGEKVLMKPASLAPVAS